MAGLWVTVNDLDEQYQESAFADEACKAASYLMWVLSGRKYTGVTTVTEHYIRFAPLVNTRLIQEASIVYSHIDETIPLVKPWAANETSIRLRGQPVSQIHAIRNGAGGIVDPDDYYLVDHSAVYLYRPALIIPADIEVTYTYGIEPPLLGKMAARRVATEFIKLWTGAEDCALPERVTSVTRQGVTYTVLDSQDFLQEMRLGIYEIDLFLKTVNPNKAQRKSKTFSPDVPTPRRYTPKPLKYQASANDLTVGKTGGSVTIPLADLDAAFLETEPGWDVSFTVRSWNGLRYSEVTDGVTIEDGNITLSVTYNKAYQALKMTTVGTWDLYATNSSNETVYVASANMLMDLTV